jgi:beta-mannosidase
MEMFQAEGKYNGTPKTRSDYIRMFEHIIPETLRREDPATFYWPASPSSGGGFDNPRNPSCGNVHAWEVWHEMEPFTGYRAGYPRYVSEFGFQSFPCLATVEGFTLPGDRNIFSRVMECHQRQSTANGRIMSYLSATYLYPAKFEVLLYASQLLQAEAVRYGVEHWRRNRGRCMGALYWQANDCWPAASWASMDCHGRWKALHYYARRFFAPVMLSCEETGELTGRLAITDEPRPVAYTARLAVANETLAPVKGRVHWALRGNGSQLLMKGEADLEVPALSSRWVERLDFPGINCLESYMSYRFETQAGVVSRGSVLFTAPKHFRLLPPGLGYAIEGNSITVWAENHARSVEITSPDGDILLSDNYFDLDGGERCTVRILEGEPKTLSLRSVYDIR